MFFSGWGATFHNRLSNLFGRWGANVALNPIKTLLCALLAVSFSSCGLVFLTTQSSPEELWVPSNSAFMQEKLFYDSNFGPFPRTEVLIVHSRGANRSLLRPAALAELFDLETQLRAIVNVEQVCDRPWAGAPCTILSPLDYFRPNPASPVNSSWFDDKDPLRLIAKGGRHPFDLELTPALLLSPYAADKTAVKDVEGMMITFLLDNNPSPAVRSLAQAVELEMIRLTRQFNSSASQIAVDLLTDRSIEDELEARIAADTTLVLISYGVMMFYVMLVLGKLDFIQSKILVGAAGVLTVVASIASALGGLSYAGVAFSPITLQVLPFLILGVGVDDIFVLTNTFARTDRREPVPERIAITLRKLGPSVLLTSASNALAFLVGTLTDMPAVSSFCIQAAIAVTACFLLLMTAYLAILTLDAHRENSGRFDLIPCMTSNRDKLDAKTGSGQREFVRPLLRRCLSPLLRSLPARLVLLVLTVAATATLGYNCSQIVRGLGVADVVPQDSYLNSFFAARDQYFGFLGPPVSLVLRSGVDLSRSDHRLQLEKLRRSLNESPFIAKIDTASFNWIDMFRQYLLVSVNESNNQPIYFSNAEMLLRTPFFDLPFPENNSALFGQWVTEFIENKYVDKNSELAIGEQFARDIVIRNEKIFTSRLPYYSVGLNKTTDYIDAIVDVRKRIEDSGLDVFTYSIFQIYFENYISLYDELLKGVLVAVAVIFVIHVVLLTSLHAALLTVVSIILSIVCIAGCFPLLSIELNPISVVNLVMTTGFLVEFTTHTVHEFQKLKGPRKTERAIVAVTDIGSAVLSGGLSTFLGIMCLAFADYVVFQVYYFRTYFLVICWGLYFGLLVVPALLATVGPSPASWADETIPDQEASPSDREIELNNKL